MILSVGVAMSSILPHLIGSQLDDLFHLERPIIDFTWENVCKTSAHYQKSADEVIQASL